MAVGTGDLNQSLKAGTYSVASPFSAPFTVTFPASWTPSALVSGDVNMSTAGSSIAVDLVDNVFADPCQSAGGPMKAARRRYRRRHRDRPDPHGRV